MFDLFIDPYPYNFYSCVFLLFLSSIVLFGTVDFLRPVSTFGFTFCLGLIKLSSTYFFFICFLCVIGVGVVGPGENNLLVGFAGVSIFLNKLGVEAVFSREVRRPD